MRLESAYWEKKEDNGHDMTWQTRNEIFFIMILKKMKSLKSWRWRRKFDATRLHFETGSRATREMRCKTRDAELDAS